MIRPSVPVLLHQLLDDAKDAARAEVDLFRARLHLRLTGARNGAILLTAAALVALLALIGLIVGTVGALATLVGPGFAGLIVLAVGLVIAGILGWLGVKQLSSKPAASTEIVATEHGG